VPDDASAADAEEGGQGVSLIRADARRLPLADGCVQCCITSPPYFGLRDYGVSGQIGLEQTPDAYVAQLVAVFREVRRVLADDGVLWLNLGDSYATGAGKVGDCPGGGEQGERWRGYRGTREGDPKNGNAMGPLIQPNRMPLPGLKPKDLIGIPWRVAFALQADGWYLRSDIIWHKPNPMPESVTDRPTKSHEYIFLLSKSERYFFDGDAIREGVAESGVIKGTDAPDEGGIFLDDGMLQEPAGERTGLAPPVQADPAGNLLAVGIRLAATVLDLAKLKDDVGLLALDAQVGQQRPEYFARADVASVPVVRRATEWASRFTRGDVSAKEFLRELHSLWVTLPDGDQLKESWRFALCNVALVNADADRTVRVHDASQIGQINSIHSQQYSTARTPRLSLHMAGTQRNDGARWRNVDGGVAARGTRNRRSVWTIPTAPYPGAHFATFPEALVEPCVLAGSRYGDRVLDPFGGTATVVRVARRLGRVGIACELNPAYLALAKARIEVTGGLPLEATA